MRVLAGLTWHVAGFNLCRVSPLWSSFGFVRLTALKSKEVDETGVCLCINCPGVPLHVLAGLAWRVAGLCMFWQACGRFVDVDVAGLALFCLPLQIRLGAVGSDVTPGQLNLPAKDRFAWHVGVWHFFAFPFRLGGGSGQ